jgi:hypothetical protein
MWTRLCPARRRVIVAANDLLVLLEDDLVASLDADGI